MRSAILGVNLSLAQISFRNSLFFDSPNVSLDNYNNLVICHVRINYIFFYLPRQNKSKTRGSRRSVWAPHSSRCTWQALCGHGLAYSHLLNQFDPEAHGSSTCQSHCQTALKAKANIVIKLWGLLTCWRSLLAWGMPFLLTRELIMNLISQRQAFARENWVLFSARKSID